MLLLTRLIARSKAIPQGKRGVGGVDMGMSDGVSNAASVDGTAEAFPDKIPDISERDDKNPDKLSRVGRSPEKIPDIAAI